MTTQHVSKSNTVVREVTENGIQWNCYLHAAETTSPETRARVYNVVIGPQGQNVQALQSALRSKSSLNKRTNYNEHNSKMPTYFGESVIWAYCKDEDGEFERIKRNINETTMIFISTDNKWATTWLREKVLLDLKWAVNKCQGTTSRPHKFIKVSDTIVGHVIGKRASNLWNIQDKQLYEFKGTRKIYMNPSVHYDNELGGFILAANSEMALCRLELAINTSVYDAKNENWKKTKTTKTTKTSKQQHKSTNTNAFETLMNDSDSDGDNS
jgi:hypothetical protein